MLMAGLSLYVLEGYNALRAVLTARFGIGQAGINNIPLLMQIALVLLLVIQLAVILALYANIKKRRRAEEALAVSDEQLTLVIEGSQLAYWDVHLTQGERTTISQGFFEMLGYAPGEIENSLSSWEALIHPEDRDAVDKALSDHYAGKTANYQHEHRFRTKNGEWRWIMGRGKVVKWTADGKPARVSGTYSDVSERHRYDDTMRSLLQVTAAVSGGDFFNCLVKELSTLLNMRYAHIGRLAGPENDTIETVSVCMDGQLIANHSYRYADFPCNQVLKGNLYVCTEAVQELFPADTGLRDMDAQCYIGAPLLGSDGRVIGLIVMVDNRPLQSRDLVEKILSILCGRAAAELEQAQIKQELVENEQRWQLALEGTGEGVWDWNLRTNSVFFSKGYKQMLGYADAEFAGRIEEWKTRIHPEDFNFVISEHERHLRGETPALSVEYRMKAKDGQYKWIHGRGKVIEFDNAGAPVRMVGTHTDITLRKRSENALQDAMVKYQSLFSSMSEGFALSQLICDENGRPVDYLILDVNPSFVPLVNIPRDQIIGKLGSNVFGKPNPDALAIYARVALTGIPDHIDTFFKPTQKHLSINIFSPERGLFASVFMDITDMINAEAALRQERNLLRMIIDHLPDAIYMKDLHFRKILANRADVMNAGAQSEEQILGKTDFEVWPDELAQRFFEDDQYVLENGKSLNKLEELITLPEQPPRWILSSKMPIFDQNGAVTGLLGIGREITESKLAVQEIQRLNAELEQRVAERTSQLESVNKELEAFAYSVSHDLRAPLRTLDGFSSALKEDYGSLLDETGQGYLTRIQGAARRMSQLIDDLLKLSRISRGEIHRTHVNLSELANQIAGELQTSNPERVVEWVVCPDIYADGDANLLRIAMENLLGNSWKFSGKLPAARIEVNFYTSDGNPVYFVRDNGAGFDMTYAGKLFGPFQRMHGATDFEGSGIGLATVQRIIRRHGGNVWAESSVGNGTTIFFTLN